MDYTWLTSLVSLALFAGMLLLLDVGRRIGVHRRVADPDGAQAGTGAVDGAVFALLGLLVAFTFSGAATRFDARRSLIVQETNDIALSAVMTDAGLRFRLTPGGITGQSWVRSPAPGSPRTVSSPPPSGISPPINRSRVDLPQPEGPTIAIVSPAAISRSSPSRTSTDPNR